MGNQQGSLEVYAIPDLDGYFVDIHGTVYSSIKSGKLKPMKVRQHKGRASKHYARVHLIHGHYLVHRLIAATFITGRILSNDEQVNHKDANTLNNHMSNLEVVTFQENVKHAIANNLYSRGDAWYTARNLQRPSDYDYRRTRTSNLGVGVSDSEAQETSNS